MVFKLKFSDEKHNETVTLYEWNGEKGAFSRLVEH